MIDSTLSFNHNISDVPKEIIDEIVVHIENELGRDYAKSKANRGRRLFPQCVRSVELVGEEGSCVISDGAEDYLVNFSLPVFDLEGGYSSIRCECQKDAIQLELARCHHMWLAQYALVQALLQKGPAEGLEKVFASLDALVSKEGEAPQEDSQRCLFQIKSDGSIQVILQRMLQRQWSKASQISWREFLVRKDLWLTKPFSGLAGLVDDAGEMNDTLSALEILAAVGGLVFMGQSGKHETCHVRQQDLFLKGTIEDGGFSVTAQFTDQVGIKQITADGFIGWGNTLEEVYFTKPERELFEFYQQLLKHPSVIPTSDQDRLLQYLAKLSHRLVLSLDDISENIEAEHKIYLRLNPLETGAIRAELLVKPSKSGSYFPPGQGATTVLEITDPKQPKQVIRDLWKEQDLASQVLEALNLGRFAQSSGLLIIPHEQALLELLDNLERPYLQDRVIVEWPEQLGESWRKTHEIAGSLESEKISLSIGGEKDWFSVRGDVTFKGQSIALKELLAALNQGRKYVQLKSGQWARITEAFAARLENLNAMLDHDEGEIHANPQNFQSLDDSQWEDHIVIKSASKNWWLLRRTISNTVAMDESIPDGLHATLRPYQVAGVKWLNRLANWGLGACLADDMGLGKTLQTIAVLFKQSSQGPSLVVAPLSVLSNWQSEIKKFCPSLNPISYRECRHLDLKLLKKGDVLITSYGLIWRELPALQGIFWNLLVLDEAQNIKNARSKTAQAAQQIIARSKIALSGTPIENHLGDLWSIFRTINPSLLGTWEKFKRVYGFPISRDNNERAKASLSSRITPYILRRLKQDHLKELPPKIEINLKVDMSESEMDVYQAIRIQAAEKLSEHEDDQQQRLQILAALSRMRQAACHPALVLEDWQHSSSKLEVFSNLAAQVVANNHKALVFSQFTRHLSLVRRKLEESGYSYAYLDGSTPPFVREQQIKAFQGGEKSFFLISLKAGGTGITLTEADTVIHMDPWWNPAIEDQATDRAYRMGQQNSVTVYRLISRDTVEELIVNLHQDKRQLATSILGQAGTTDKLDLKQLAQLLVKPSANADLRP